MVLAGRANDMVAATTSPGRHGCHNHVVARRAGAAWWSRAGGAGFAQMPRTCVTPPGSRKARPVCGASRREGVRARKSVRFVFRCRLGRRGGALAQWQSSGLLTHWFRVRPPGAPPGQTSLLDGSAWHGLSHECRQPRYRAVTATARSGYIQQLPSGSFRVSVYAGTDPLTDRQIRLRRTCKTERAAQIELGRLLEQLNG